MKKISVVCLLLASLPHAQGDDGNGTAQAADKSKADEAGFVIVMSGQTNAEKPKPFTIKIKGDKARMDSDDSIMIGDLASGDVVMVFPKYKQFWKIAGADFKKFQFKTPDELAAEAAAAPEVVDTGKQEKVAGYNAEIYTAYDPKRKVKATTWISREVPHYEILQRFLRKMELAMKARDPECPDFTKIEGVEVKEEVVDEETSKTITSTNTLVSVKEEPIADSEFQIPEGYTSFPNENNDADHLMR